MKSKKNLQTLFSTSYEQDLEMMYWHMNGATIFMMQAQDTIMIPRFDYLSASLGERYVFIIYCFDPASVHNSLPSSSANADTLFWNISFYHIKICIQVRKFSCVMFFKPICLNKSLREALN